MDRIMAIKSQKDTFYEDEIVAHLGTEVPMIVVCNRRGR